MATGLGAAVASALNLTGAAATATAVAVNVAATVAVSYATQKYSQRQLDDNRIGEQDILIRASTQPLNVVYGEALTAGVITYMNQRQIKADLIYDLYIAVAHAGHECESLTDLYYNDDHLRDGTELDWAQGNVVSGRWFVLKNGFYSVTIERNLGAADQFVSPLLQGGFPTDFTANHRGRGICYTVHKFSKFPSSAQVFSAGAPSNIRALIRGKKDIYDPRLDSSPGSSPNTTGFQSWTQNPVLIAADYLRTYMGFPDERIDWSNIATEAARCDTLVSTPEGSQARYSCNGNLSLGAKHRDNVQAILQTCLGTLNKSNGKWRVFPGGYRTPVVALGNADLSDMVTQHSQPRKERYNTVRGTYISKDQNWTEQDFPEVTDASMVSRDGGELLPRQLDLRMVNDDYQAQRLAYLLLQQSENQRSFSVPANLKGLRLTPGAYATIDRDVNNWSSKPFRCESWIYRPSLEGSEGEASIELVMREDEASRWVDPDIPDYTTRSASGVIQTPDPEVIPPTNFTASDGQGAIDCMWTNPEDPTGYDFLRIYASTDSSFANATVFWEGIANSTRVPLAPGQQRWLWIVAVFQDQESDRDPNSDTSTVTATSQQATGTAVDGLTPVFVYRISASQPATPTGNMPAGWTAAPTGDGTAQEWVSSNVKDSSGVVQGAWSAPSRWSGVPGADGNDGNDGVDGNDGNDGLPGQDAEFIYTAGDAVRLTDVAATARSATNTFERIKAFGMKGTGTVRVRYRVDGGALVQGEILFRQGSTDILTVPVTASGSPTDLFSDVSVLNTTQNFEMWVRRIGGGSLVFSNVALWVESITGDTVEQD